VASSTQRRAPALDPAAGSDPDPHDPTAQRGTDHPQAAARGPMLPASQVAAARRAGSNTASNRQPSITTSILAVPDAWPARPQTEDGRAPLGASRAGSRTPTRSTRRIPRAHVRPRPSPPPASRRPLRRNALYGSLKIRKGGRPARLRHSRNRRETRATPSGELAAEPSERFGHRASERDACLSWRQGPAQANPTSEQLPRAKSSAARASLRKDARVYPPSQRDVPVFPGRVSLALAGQHLERSD
jgi:hypothetical protein